MAENIGNNELGIERDGDLAVIRTPTGTHQILYENHSNPADPNLFSRTPDGIFIELIGRYSDLSRGDINADVDTENLTETARYAQCHEIPLFYGDISLTELGRKRMAFEDNLASAQVIVGTVNMLVVAAYLTEHGISSESALPLSFVTLGSLWAASHLGRLVSDNPRIHKSLSVLHPGSNILTLHLRNAILAYKQMWLMDQIEGNPNFGMIIGRAHAGIENNLKRPKKATLDFISRYRWLLARASRQEELYSILQIDYDASSRQWDRTQLFTVPELEELFT